ncbi:MAG: polynucleotide adenylyltransferase PcnB [Gammaproteobacteria bacterium]|nr:polynucleotide adenylyltransferase PcnB [Gammaproteobacteria bacterium]NIR88856.1 polynucleotide adenylyltransferase PcnB [Gammaproteobacteria bacterium]NIU06460.1 polynucleotide adenylyltransferase PcnB [Gammaproteobacteria bacterium]NIV53352.1 polynucleotide adenylyltransferase PcnB [Gammaproteobacteria bacterium]NIV74071.1 polynucleotide adenylyltransferase PcnB [Gammaproteobacteria bacterium]
MPRSSHNISRANISEHALKVLYRLKSAGFESYLVGGGVRDLLLGREPKDFDVVTDARPEEIKALFRNCRLIGRRFRLAHVRFGSEIVEVATFRARGDTFGDAARLQVDGRIVRDNVYGTFEDDAWRRDFTVNSLYYNIRDFSVVDLTGGMSDLQAGLVRCIGDPEASFREDPVRMLRAVRFAAKLGFRIEPETEAPIRRFTHLLEGTPPARLFEEVLKLFQGGFAAQSFELLRRYELFGALFPETDACLAQEVNGFPSVLAARALANTDARIAEGKPVTPAFLFAALLWEPVRGRAREYTADGLSETQAMERAGAEVVAGQVHHVAIPRRFGAVAQEIWRLQPRFAKRRGKAALGLLAHPRFRAAYDFLLLRAESGEDVAEWAEWWTRFQETDDKGRRALMGRVAPRRKRRRRRRKAEAS